MVGNVYLKSVFDIIIVVWIIEIKNIFRHIIIAKKDNFSLLMLLYIILLKWLCHIKLKDFFLDTQTRF